MALALALAQAGRRSLVLEARPEFSIAGAGIQIGPNGTRVLQKLGVADALAPLAGCARGHSRLSRNAGQRLARLPLGSWIAQRHGAPYWVAHRADLHKVLLEAVRRSDLVEIEMGFVASELSQEGDAVTLKSEAGRTAQGAGSLARMACGRACVRRWRPAWGRSSPARAPAGSCCPPSAPAGSPRTPWAMAQSRRSYRPLSLRGGREIAVVVIAEEAWQSRVWDADIDRVHLGRALACFTRELETVLLDAPGWRRWSLHRLPALSQWNSGRAGLIGDAAHPMFPYLAQGGVLALEDAVELASCLTARGADVSGGFALFAQRRRERAARVQGRVRATARSITCRHPFRLRAMRPSPLRRERC